MLFQNVFPKTARARSSWRRRTSRKYGRGCALERATSSYPLMTDLAPPTADHVDLRRAARAEGRRVEMHPDDAARGTYATERGACGRFGESGALRITE